MRCRLGLNTPRAANTALITAAQLQLQLQLQLDSRLVQLDNKDLSTDFQAYSAKKRYT